jgi:toxin FitB
VTRYLVDTNVISATSPTAVVTRPELIEWMDLHSSYLFLSAVTIAEIADGIAKAKREGAKRKAADLSAWLRTVLHLYGDRVLPFDGPTAEIAGVLAGARPWSFSTLCRYRHCGNGTSA